MYTNDSSSSNLIMQSCKKRLRKTSRNNVCTYDSKYNDSKVILMFRLTKTSVTGSALHTYGRLAVKNIQYIGILLNIRRLDFALFANTFCGFIHLPLMFYYIALKN